MNKHTPEPWQIAAPEDENDTWLVLCSSPHEVAYLARRYSGERRLDIEEANARRIVACVNFCTGLKTEDMERHSEMALEVEDEMQSDLLKALEQRDELLAALKAIIEACDRCGNDDDKSIVDEFTQEMEDTARAAIAKAEAAA